MELIIFTGIPGSGKSTFYIRNFLNTHVRISLDLLNTRNKEKKYLNLGYEMHQRMVVDNTNVKKADRAKYIEQAKKHKYRVSGYYFNADPKECLQRNAERTGKGKVDDKAIFIKYNQLEKPAFSEGYDRLMEVTIEKGEFHVRNTGKGKELE